MKNMQKINGVKAEDVRSNPIGMVIDKKPLKYKVISEEGEYCNSYSVYNDFEKEVNLHLKDGWKLCGGVSVGSIGNDHFCICQAMIKEEITE